MKTVGASVVVSGLAGCSGNDTDTGDDDGTNADGESNDDSAESEDTSGDDTSSGDSGGGGSNNAEDEDPEDTQSGDQDSSENEGGNDEEFVQESMGSVGRDDISELEIVAWESEVTDIEFNVRVAIRNNGDQQADAREYTYQIVPYDESGTALETTGDSVAYPTTTEIGPDEVSSVEATPAMDADPEEVASYEILLHCDGPFAEGVYCSS
ncbi:hypothetical protein ACFQJ7_05585 [Halovenus rubra]|uniref:DUF4352 domain-containing protein n=1 Tax=Halovenus rubra TaxID=869890 RepID=A0ABD5X3E8_9EURY